MVDAHGTTLDFPQWMWTPSFRTHSKGLEVKAFTEKEKCLIYFPRVFAMRNIFSESWACYFTPGIWAQGHSPLSTEPGLPDTQGQERWKEREGWSGYKWGYEDKRTNFKLIVFCFLLFFFFLILYHHSSFPINLERLMEEWAYLVNDATSAVVE